GEKNHWLLYDPSNEMFSLATGTLGSELELIGFRSKDALAEWYGGSATAKCNALCDFTTLLPNNHLAAGSTMHKLY
ncbi:MAG: hypothetical protein ACXV8P_07250, partial [Methylobacter sp.]